MAHPALTLRSQCPNLACHRCHALLRIGVRCTSMITYWTPNTHKDQGVLNLVTCLWRGLVSLYVPHIHFRRVSWTMSFHELIIYRHWTTSRRWCWWGRHATVPHRCCPNIIKVAKEKRLHVKDSSPTQDKTKERGHMCGKGRGATLSDLETLKLN